MTTKNKEIAVAENIMANGEFEFYKATDFGINFNPGTPREKWLEITKELCAVTVGAHVHKARAMFKLGDALRYGEIAYGEEYAQAIEETRQFMAALSEKTIANLMSVCGAIAPEIRHPDTLSLEHHKTVQGLDEKQQGQFLARAEAESMTVSTLSREVAFTECTDEEKEEIDNRLADGKTIADLTAAQIRSMLKRIRAGEEEPTKKAIIDLKSEEGLQHAAEKIAEYFREYDQTEEAAVSPVSKWKVDRKTKWAALGLIAKIARRMGHAR